MSDLNGPGKVVGSYRLVPVDQLTTSPLNPNVESPFIFEKLVESIKEFGFIDPIITRKVHGRYEVVGGAHRLRAAQKLNMTEVPIVDVDDLDDVSARKLLIVLNETKGVADQDMLAQLVQSIREDGGEDALCVLPFNDFQLSDLLDDRDPPQPHEENDTVFAEEKAQKVTKNDVATCLELEGATQQQLRSLILAIRAWRNSKSASTPVWQLLLQALKVQP